MRLKLMKLWEVLESMGRAQAAARLAAMGHQEAAKNLILGHKES